MKEGVAERIYDARLNDGFHVFVFGSNEAGRHGAGAAKVALQHWGAELGDGVGHRGQSYAIPTKDRHLRTLSLEVIAGYVARFKEYAYHNADLTFLVTRIGCGLAGYTDAQIAPLFKDSPSNCVLPHGWPDIAPVDAPPIPP